MSNKLLIIRKIIVLLSALLLLASVVHAETEKYIYDANQRLKNVVRVLNAQQRFEYDDLTNITKKTVLNEPDSDLDGITNAEESAQGFNPNNADQNSNGVLDGEEFFVQQRNPSLVDSNNNGIPDNIDQQAGSGISVLSYKAALNTSFIGALTKMSGQIPFTWRLMSGALPTGIVLDQATGKISGTPTVAGEFTAGYTVTDSLSATYTASVTISVSQNSIQLESSTYTAWDTDGVVNVQVRRNYAGNAVSVNYVLLPGTATAGADYVNASGTLSFAIGEAVKTIRIQLLNNLTSGLDRQFSLQLSAPQNIVLGTNVIAIIILKHFDQSPGIIEFSQATYNVLENVGVVNVDVRRHNGLKGDVSVNVPGVAELLFKEGEYTKTIQIPVVLDEKYPEPLEIKTLTLINPTNGAQIGSINRAVINISDVLMTGTGPGKFRFSWNDESNKIVREDIGTVTLTVNRVGGSTGTASVNYMTTQCGWPCNQAFPFYPAATPDLDYVAKTGVLTFANGETQKTITISVINDGVLSESDENITLQLYSPTNGAVIESSQYHSVVIIDNLGVGYAVIFEENIDASESSGKADVHVRRTDNNGSLTFTYTTDVTFAAGYTATRNVDYTATTGSATFTEGVNDLIISIPLAIDGIYDPNETFSVELNKDPNAVAIFDDVTITIKDVPPAPDLVQQSFNIPDDLHNDAYVGAIQHARYPGVVFTYTILNGNVNNVVRINQNGQLYVNDATQLNAVATPVYNLEITVTNDGGLSSTGHYIINVQDQLPVNITMLSKSYLGAQSSNAGGFVNSMSHDGRYVLFSSCSTDIHVDDANNACDMFRKDMATNITEIVSVDINGVSSGNANSYMEKWIIDATTTHYNPTSNQAMSGDGRYIVFISDADNLVADDVNGLPDIFVRDMKLKLTKLITRDQNGYAPGLYVGSVNFTLKPRIQISDNGSFVFFNVSTTGLIAGDVTRSLRSYVYNVNTNQLKYIYTKADGDGAHVVWEKISASGQYVLFLGSNNIFWQNLPTPNIRNVYVSDIVNNSVKLVSTRADGLEGANGDSYGVDMSTDGAVVLFTSKATNIVPGINTSDTRLFCALCYGVLYRKNILTGEVRLITNEYVTLYAVDKPRLSPDGRYIFFSSNDQDLTSFHMGNVYNLFTYDSLNNAILLITRMSQAAPLPRDYPNKGVLVPTVDEASESIIFTAYDPAIAGMSLDYNHLCSQLYKYNMVTKEVRLLSLDIAGGFGDFITTARGNGVQVVYDCISPVASYRASSNNKYIVFNSLFSNLTHDNDVNGHVTDGYYWSEDGTMPINPDLTPPNFALPLATLTVEASGELTNIILPIVIALDDKDGEIQAVPSNAGPFSLGVHTITWIATDKSGKTASVQQQIIVLDTTPPQLIVPSNTTYEANSVSMVVDLGQPTVFDLADPLVVAAASTTGPFSLGQHYIVWTARDASGNVSTATQTIIVQDSVKPTLIIPADIRRGVSSNQLVAISLQTATAFDSFNVAISNNAPALFPIGVTSVRWTATDQNGNTAIKDQTVTVYVDNQSPVVTAPADITLQTSQRVVSLNMGQAAAVDNLDGVLVPYPSNSSPFAPGSYQITWRAQDSAGNVGTATQRLTITSTNADVDTDGVSDAWEMSHYGNLNQNMLTDINGNGVIDIQDYMNETNTITTQVARLQTNQGTQLNINLADYVTDLPGGSLVFSGMNNSGNGQVTQLLNGQVAYTPNANFTGTEQFRYVVTNGTSNTAIGFVYINVISTVARDGDVNGDGAVNVSDVMLAQRHVLGLQILDALSVARGDLYPVAGDGQLTISDVLLIQKAVIQRDNAISDTDGDLLPNAWEVANQLNPNVKDAADDSDGDGLTNAQEFSLGTLANKPDSDGDKIDDGTEISVGTNPLNILSFPVVVTSSPVTMATVGIHYSYVLNANYADVTFTLSSAPPGMILVNNGGIMSLDWTPTSQNVGISIITIKPTTTGSVPSIPQTFTLSVKAADGDVNGDGITDIADVILVQRHVLGVITLTSSQSTAADMYPAGYPDGFVNISDLLLLERKVLEGK